VKAQEPPAPSGRESARRFAKRLALAFFFAWLVMQMAIADRPPPPGFLLLVLLDAIAAGGIYYRVAHYLQWQSSCRPHRPLLVLGDGVVIGLSSALVIMLFSAGEPSVTPTAIDRLIWFAVFAAIGIANATLVYACVAASRRRA